MAELESEGSKTRAGVAAFLRDFASELEAADPRPAETGTGERVEAERTTGEDQTTRSGTGVDDSDTGESSDLDPNRITLVVGGNSATVTIPETVEFDVEVDSRSPMLRSGVRQEIDFELSWEVENPDEATDDLIQIE